MVIEATWNVRGRDLPYDRLQTSTFSGDDLISNRFPFFALFLFGFLIRTASAQDSLYWECDTVPRGQSARVVSLLGNEDVGCEASQPCGPVQETVKALPEGGTEHFHFRMRNDVVVKDGAFEIRDGAKRLKQQGSYVSGKRSGAWITWFPDGKKKSEAGYVDGKLQGLHREYFPNGKVMDEFKYRDGKIDCGDGYHKSWYAGGRLKFEMDVRDRKLSRYVFYDSLGKELNLPVILNP